MLNETIKLVIHRFQGISEILFVHKELQIIGEENDY